MLSAVAASHQFYAPSFNRSGGDTPRGTESAGKDTDRQNQQASAGNAQRAAASETRAAIDPAEKSDQTRNDPRRAREQAKAPSNPADPESNLNEEQKKEVQRLKERDKEVRAHEQAHKAAGGPYASAPTYELKTGPDKKQYAVSGEVKIDTAPVAGNPEATARKMETVIRAALAPSEPSAQDQAVARQAQASKIAAQAEAREKRQKELDGEGEGSESGAAPVLEKPLDANKTEKDGSKSDDLFLQQAIELYGAIQNAQQQAATAFGLF